LISPLIDPQGIIEPGGMKTNLIGFILLLTISGKIVLIMYQSVKDPDFGVTPEPGNKITYL